MYSNISFVMVGVYQEFGRLAEFLNNQEVSRGKDSAK